MHAGNTLKRNMAIASIYAIQKHFGFAPKCSIMRMNCLWSVKVEPVLMQIFSMYISYTCIFALLFSQKQSNVRYLSVLDNQAGGDKLDTHSQRQAGYSR